jgi:hypothetical protein
MEIAAVATARVLAVLCWHLTIRPEDLRLWCPPVARRYGAPNILLTPA